MQIIYTNQTIPTGKFKGIFLAGPTPRDRQTLSWRPSALSTLSDLNYDGTVIVPEFKVPPVVFDYDAQVEWEHQGLTQAEWIVFWVPRELKSMPAFTTNVEFGRFAHLSKTFYGRPDSAPKNRYLDWYYKKCNFRPVYNNLEEMLKQIV